MNRFSLFLLLCAALVLFTACKDKEVDDCPPAPEYRIIIEECSDNIVIQEKFVISHGSVCQFRPVRFSCSHDAVSYRWIIGSDQTVRTEKQTIVTFGNNVNYSVPCTLFVTYQANYCDPEILVTDTIVQNVFVYTKTEIPLLGRFYGADLQAPQDSYEVVISCPYDSVTWIYRSTINNFPNGCNYNWFRVIGFSPTAWGFKTHYNDNSGCLNPIMQANLSIDTTTLTIDYSVRVENYFDAPRVNKHFRGVRVQ